MVRLLFRASRPIAMGPLFRPFEHWRAYWSKMGANEIQAGSFVSIIFKKCWGQMPSLRVHWVRRKRAASQYSRGFNVVDDNDCDAVDVVQMV